MPMRPELRQEWVKAGYCSRMGSAEVDRPPPRDFRRLYYLTSTEFAVSNIGLGRIKVARVLDLNDPFELMAVNIRERPKRHVITDFKGSYDSHKGLLCFSSNWTNPVLWSHYGDKHRGICLGFDVKTHLAEEVKYVDKREIKSLDTGELELDKETYKI